MAPLSRRTVLRGLGTALSLPLLDAMFATHARALTPVEPSLTLRLGFLYVPNGAHMPDWTPSATGHDFEFGATLAPLEPWKRSVLVLSGLTLDKARANGDGPGDHARASAAFLTACQPVKSDGATIRAGVSADQLAARELGQHTRFRSLELGVEAGAESGQCDSGYACAYSSNLSWSAPHTPCPKEVDPRLVFERLFVDGEPGESAAARAQRNQRRQSILDLVREDARRLESRLGAQDKRKLDEYQSAIRELETRLARSAATGSLVPESERPKGIPKDYGEHIRLLADVLVLAWRTDATRVATFSFANEGSNRSYAFLGAPEGHHDLSHHGKEAHKLEKLAKINRYHVEQLAHFLKRLSETEEGDSNLLARSAIVYGSGIGDGNRHNHDELPILVAGELGGKLASGRHLRFEPETPLANLYVTLLERFGVSSTRVGDSTGALAL